MRGVLVSLVAATLCALWLFTTRERPTVALAERNSDHYSHVSAAALAVHHGSAIWSGPVAELCDPVLGNRDPRIPRLRTQAAALGVAPVDLCPTTASWARQPLVVNWSMFPRPYPPGNVLLFAPVGLAYAGGHISFDVACALAVFLCALGANLSLVTLGLALGLHRSHERPFALWIVFGLAALFVVGWSLGGIYDGWALAPLCLAAWAHREQKPAWVWFGFCVACFMHFRALWYLPLGIHALVALYKANKVGRLAPVDRTRAAVGLLFVAPAALVFVLLLPSLPEFPVNHVTYVFGLGEAPAATWAALMTCFAVAIGVALRGDRMWGACALWLLIMATSARQAMPWHALSLVPLFALTPREPPALRAWHLAIAAVFFELVARTFFQMTLWPSWIGVAWQRFG